MNEEQEKAYDPKSTEEKIYKLWEESGYFNPDNHSIASTGSANKVPERSRRTSYAIHLPPPNVTGSLHMGHALNATITDILIRYHRMRGDRTVWFPGTDHAGIATQNVVEKQLRKEGVSRWDLGREKFIEKVWEWKEKYGNIIIEQLKKLGASCDWSRLRFTMDSEYAKWVQKAFLHYYEQGLIYRGKRIVSWCTACQTSLSDLEVEYKEEQGKLWYIKYPLADASASVTVATTRPETMLGDAAVAVNPKDARYKKLVGKKILLPIQNREIPIVADDAIDMAFGTGAVKVTPAHDLLDAEIAERHKLEPIDIIDERGRMTEAAGENFKGLKVLEAREKVVKELEEAGLLERTEDYKHNVAICYRSGTVLEPLRSNQWFLKMGELAKKTLKTIKSGKTKIIPENFEKVPLPWLENIKDWCISRQIWWGHQLPVWFKTSPGSDMEAVHFKKGVLYKKLGFQNDAEFDHFSHKLDPDGKRNISWASYPSNEDEIQLYRGYINVLKERGLIDEAWLESKKIHRKTSEAKIFVGEKPPEPIGWIQSTDVLDTWFSSALWPFAGLSEKDRKDFYPSNVLITARDIINLWVARMIFSGLEFMGETPFPETLIHATILTKEGKRMSKSLGTGIDPLGLIDKYGADATRFGIIWQAMGTQDIHWDETAVMAGKKFANKIWNIGRFCLGKIGSIKHQASSVKPTAAEDQEILEKLEKVKKEIEQDIKNYNLGPALHKAYEFVWHEFADKYIELSKKREDENVKMVLGQILVDSLKLLHPFMPFITEEIYQKLSLGNLIIEKW